MVESFLWFLPIWALIIPITQPPLVAYLWRRNTRPWFLAVVGVPVCVLAWVGVLAATFRIINGPERMYAVSLVAANAEQGSEAALAAIVGVSLSAGIVIAGTQVVLSVLRFFFKRK